MNTRPPLREDKDVRAIKCHWTPNGGGRVDCTRLYSLYYKLNDAVKIAKDADGNMKMIAKDKIPSNTVLLVEEPVLSLTGRNVGRNIHDLQYWTHFIVTRDVDKVINMNAYYPRKWDEDCEESKKTLIELNEKQDPKSRLHGDAIVRMIYVGFKLRCNLFGICNGVTLFRLASMFNHSCAPNASHTFEKDMMVVRTNVNIEKDEEITIEYVPKNQHKSLWFDCLCSHCKDIQRKA